MSNANVNRSGQNLATGDARALFQEKWMLEVMTAYYTANITEGRFLERSISEGKSAKFPTTGLAGGGFHTPGAEIVGRIIKGSEKVIEIDDLLYSDAFLAQIDEAMNHINVRQPYTQAMGEFLAKVNDYHKMLTIIKAARSLGNIPGETAGGARLVDPAMKTDAAKLAGALFAASTQFDENGVPSLGRTAYLKPLALALLVQNKDTINKDYGGAGSYSNGTISAIAGIDLAKTTHIPQANYSTGAGLDAAVRAIFGQEVTGEILPVKYRLDASTTAGLVTHSSAIGTVKLLSMDLSMDYDPRRKGTLIVASQAQGTGVLRPECAIELATAAVAP